MTLRSIVRRGACACVPLVVAGACKHAGDAGDAGDSAKPVVQVSTTIVTARPFTPTVGAIGTVIPRTGHVALLGAPGPSRVAHINTAVGRHVAAGEALIELDPVPYQIATQAADAALSTAQKAADRAQRLADDGFGTRRDAEQAAGDLARAKEDAANAHRSQDLSILRSPIPGVVTQLNASLGASVDANQPLIQIADPSALDVVINVTPTDAGHISVGARVALRAGQNATGDPLGSATVVDISGTVDSASRGVAIRVEAPATRRPLRIGETVFAEIPVASFARALLVPSAAIVPEGDVFQVFVIDSASMAHEREVTIGAKTDSMTQILTGLKAGEKIVTTGAFAVQDSVMVTEFKAGASSGARKGGGDSSDSGAPPSKAAPTKKGPPGPPGQPELP